MIEVQCPSCQTRYRIDESVLPKDSPTFKCSRCGHVFTGDPRQNRRPPIITPKNAPPKPAPQAGPGAAPEAASSPPSEGQRAPAAEAAPQSQPIPPGRPPAPPPPSPPAGDPQRQAPIQHPNPPGPSAGSQSADSSSPQVASPPPAAAAQDDTAAAPAAGPAPQSDADNPLARSFAEEEAKDSENLSFDFDDDSDERHQLGEEPEGEDSAEDSSDRWQVGDSQEDPLEELRRTPDFNRHHAPRTSARQVSRRPERPAPVTDDYEGRGRVRSSGFFLGLFTLVVIGFVIVTFILGISPSTSRALLARLPLVGSEFAMTKASQSAVALSGLHAQYRMLDKHRAALIVSGRAENRGDRPLHTIQIAVSLVDGDRHPVVTQTVFCGDLVSPKIVSQMTPHELQFFQKLAPPNNFKLKAGDSSPFFVMFINPPPNAASFQASVLKAEPVAEQTAASGI